ncbi:MAG: hypothetical protein SFW35_04700 [Chitinophagales bacterium]|nr:hypothetical protein [Chitinophagales bacterium]
MLDIVLCICFSAALVIVFKLVERYGANLFPVIVVNYLAASIASMAFGGAATTMHLDSTLLMPAMLLGLLFIFVFTAVGLSVQQSGITVTAIAQKMSLAIPIAAAFYLYGDKITVLKLIGIGLALVAIVLTTRKDQPTDNTNKGKNLTAILLPILVFVGSGFCDTGINYSQRIYLQGVPYAGFIALLFGTAFFAGLLFLLFKRFRQDYKLGWKELGWGVALGLPNYFSLYFMIRSLEFSGMESSLVYPILNIGTVSAATVTAFFVFKEKLSLINVIGLIMALAAIVVLSIGGGQ